MKSFWTRKETIVAVVASLLALTEILDATIVSVALPDMMGSLGMNINQSSWIMTSYIIAAAICMPITGLVARKYGRRKVMLVSVIIFAISSALCGTATSQDEIIIFRILQGIGGAFIPTLAQAYIVESFSKKEQPKMLTIYSLCCILGPVLGPVLGGVITEHMNWGWIFYVNIPICIIGFIILYLYMTESSTKKVKIDYTSFLFLALGVGLIEIVLNEGNNKGWFSSNFIIVSFVYGIIFVGFFIWRGLLGKSVLDFRIFKNRNYVISCLIMIVFYALVMVQLSFFPTMLETMFSYPRVTTGLIASPRGLISLICAPIIIKLSQKMDSRFLMIFGFAIFGLASYQLSGMAPSTSMTYILSPILLQGISLTTIYVLLTIYAYSYLAKELSNTAAGAYNFFRNIGNSIGTAIAATILSHQGQNVWHSLSKFINPASPNYKLWVQHISNTGVSSSIMAKKIISFHSSFISYIDLFEFALVGTVVVMFSPLLLKKISHKKTQTTI